MLFVYLSVSLFLLSILLLVGIFFCLSVCVLSGHVVTKKQLFSSKFFFKIFLQDKCQKFSPSLKNNRGVKEIIAHRLHFKCFPLCHSSECKLSHISAHCEKNLQLKKTVLTVFKSVSVKKSNFEVFVRHSECYHRLLQKV